MKDMALNGAAEKNGDTGLTLTVLGCGITLLLDAILRGHELIRYGGAIQERWAPRF